MKKAIVIAFLVLSHSSQVLSKSTTRIEAPRPQVGTLAGGWRYVCQDGLPIGGPMTLVLGTDGSAREITRLTVPKGIAVVTGEGTWKPGGEDAGHPGWRRMTLAWDDGKTIVHSRYMLVPDLDVLEVIAEDGKHAGARFLYVREKS